MNIRTFLLTFTEKGLKRFTEKERIALGKELKKGFRDYYSKLSGYESTDQFFPPFGAHGSLSKKSKKELDDKYTNYNYLQAGLGSTTFLVDGKFHSIITRLGQISKVRRRLNHLLRAEARKMKK